MLRSYHAYIPARIGRGYKRKLVMRTLALTIIFSHFHLSCCSAFSDSPASLSLYSSGRRA